MELIVLGSGAAFSRNGPAGVRNPAGLALRLGDGRLLLFDLGFGNVRQLARAGLDASRITDVFVSHRHPDHVGDLPALLFLLRYDVRPRSGRVRFWGPVGFVRFVRLLQRAWAPWLSPRGYRLEVREVSGRVAREGWVAETLPVPHPTPAYAVRFTYRGKAFVYSGDTGFSAALPEFAAGADLFALECTLAERAYEPDGGHMSPRLAVETLRASGCRKGLLVHVTEDSQREARRLARGSPYAVARDLQRVAIY